MINERRKTQIRSHAVTLAKFLREQVGPEWANHLGLDPKRAGEWTRGGIDVLMARPRELACMAYVAGVAGGEAYLMAVGEQVDAMLRPEGLLERIDFVAKGMPLNVAFHRGETIEKVLAELTIVYREKAQRLLAARLIATPSMVTSYQNTEQAVLAWSDAMLAYMTGVPIPEHWGLDRVIVDRPWLVAFHLCHREQGYLGESKRALSLVSSSEADKEEHQQTGFAVVSLPKRPRLETMLVGEYSGTSMVVALGPHLLSVIVFDRDTGLEAVVHQLSEDYENRGARWEVRARNWSDLRTSLANRFTPKTRPELCINNLPVIAIRTPVAPVVRAEVPIPSLNTRTLDPEAVLPHASMA